MSLPAIYETVVSHVRQTPVHNAFRYRSYHWLVDLDHLPHLPAALRPLARFEAADHFGRPGTSLRGNVDAFLAAHGIRLAGGRVLMLAHARVFGHVFNPLTVYWCLGDDGTPAAVIAEVHNTHGGLHCYLLNPDELGRATTDKRFSVSPFYPVDGRYEMRLPEPGETLDLSVTLRRPDDRPFVATVRGIRRPATPQVLLRQAARCPSVTRLGAAQIRYQGLRLWARRLPVVPRDPATTRPGHPVLTPGRVDGGAGGEAARLTGESL